jgi:hypothetical protein
VLDSYERQLCTYAHILQSRYGKTPDRLLLYWTAEPTKDAALMEFAYRPELVDNAAQHFDYVIRSIKQKNFDVITPPERKVCKECDIRNLCINERLIPAFRSN